MENNSIIDTIMERVPTDSSGKWVAVSDVRSVITSVITSLQPAWDHYSDLPSPSAYQNIKQDVE